MNDSEFLHAAMEDTQGTIRSIDIRCGFLFVLLLSPMAVGDKLLSWAVACNHSCLVRLLIGASFLVWFLALATLFAAVAALSNPQDHVRQPTGVTGSFYSGDLYRAGLLAHFWDRYVTSHRTLDEEIANLPSSQTAIVRELAFERMKLAFVRTVKIRRYNSALVLTPIAFLLGLASYASSLI